MRKGTGRCSLLDSNSNLLGFYFSVGAGIGFVSGDTELNHVKLSVNFCGVISNVEILDLQTNMFSFMF